MNSNFCIEIIKRSDCINFSAHEYKSLDLQEDTASISSYVDVIPPFPITEISNKASSAESWDETQEERNAADEAMEVVAVYTISNPTGKVSALIKIKVSLIFFVDRSSIFFFVDFY